MTWLPSGREWGENSHLAQHDTFTLCLFLRAERIRRLTIEMRCQRLPTIWVKFSRLWRGGWRSRRKQSPIPARPLAAPANPRVAASQPNKPTAAPKPDADRQPLPPLHDVQADYAGASLSVGEESQGSKGTSRRCCGSGRKVVLLVAHAAASSSLLRLLLLGESAAAASMAAQKEKEELLTSRVEHLRRRRKHPRRQELCRLL